MARSVSGHTRASAARAPVGMHFARSTPTTFAEHSFPDISVLAMLRKLAEDKAAPKMFTPWRLRKQHPVAAHVVAPPPHQRASAVAPEGSGKTATLLGAGERRDSAGELYYFTEFTVQSERPAFYRHNLAGAWRSVGGSNNCTGVHAESFQCSAACGLAAATPCSAAASDVCWRLLLEGMQTSGLAAALMESRQSDLSACRAPSAPPAMQCTQRATACFTRSTASPRRRAGRRTRLASAARQNPSPSSTAAPPPRASLTACERHLGSTRPASLHFMPVHAFHFTRNHSASAEHSERTLRGWPARVNAQARGATPACEAWRKGLVPRQPHAASGLPSNPGSSFQHEVVQGHLALGQR